MSGFIVFVAVVLGISVWLEFRRRAEVERRIKAIQVSDVDNMNGIDFEYYVCRLLTHQGYSANVTQASNDFGVDVVARRGGDQFAVQIKRYSKSVPRTAISDAVAGKSHYNCNAAMVVTNHYFTKGAKELARSTGCVLVDRDVLTEWILVYQGEDMRGSASSLAQETTRRSASVDRPSSTQERPSETLRVPTMHAREGGAGEGSSLFARIEVERDEERTEFAHAEDLTAMRHMSVAEDPDVKRIALREYPRDAEMQKYTYDNQLAAKRYMSTVEDPDVKNIAVREYPSDYEMQKYTYDNQATAKLYMSAVEELDVKEVVLREYPDDYEMQKYTYDNQVAAKHYMSAVEEFDVKSIALREYPSDYEMQKYTYDNQLAAKRYLSTAEDLGARRAALKEYPDDYEMQRYTYDNRLAVR